MEHRATLHDLKQGLELRTGERHVLIVGRPSAYRLEIGESFFNTASAVFLPDVPLEMQEGVADRVQFDVNDLWAAFQSAYPEYANTLWNTRFVPPDYAARKTGALLLMTLLRFQQEDPAYRLIIAGHADRAGGAGDNQVLSEARAKTTLAVLQGHRDSFVALCKKNHVADDDAVFVGYAARTRAWPCDLEEGAQAGPREIRQFQESYNDQFGAAVVVGKDAVFYPMAVVKAGGLARFGERTLQLAMEGPYPTATSADGSRPFQLFTRWYAFILTYPHGRLGQPAQVT